MRRLALLAALLLVPVGGVSAQQAAPDRVPPVDTTVVVVRLRDRTEYVGKVTARDDSTLTLTGPSGTATLIPLRLVDGWRASSFDFVDGRLRTRDPDVSRLFIGSTGRTLPSGSVTFTDYFLFFPMLSLGVLDGLTISAGMSILPGASSQILYFAPKIGVVRSPKLNVAIGGLYAKVPDESGYAGDVYLATTFGSVDQALTVTVGYPFANGDRTREPGLMVGGETRVGRDTKLMVELWRAPGVSEMPLIFGFRGFGRKVSVDYGLMRVLGAHVSGMPFIPWIDFSMRF